MGFDGRASARAVRHTTAGMNRVPLRRDAAGEAPLARLADYRPGSVFGQLTKPDLSAREVEVLLTWLASESKEQAADTLFISASTVSTHLARIRAKYAAAGRIAPTKTHLFARALQDGYTSLDRW